MSYHLPGSAAMADLWSRPVAISTARVWDAMMGELLARLLGHDDYVSFADFDPTGKLVITSRDNTGKIWNWETGRAVRVLAGGHDKAIEKESSAQMERWLLPLVKIGAFACGRSDLQSLPFAKMDIKAHSTISHSVLTAISSPPAVQTARHTSGISRASR